YKTSDCALNRTTFCYTIMFYLFYFGSELLKHNFIYLDSYFMLMKNAISYRAACLIQTLTLKRNLANMSAYSVSFDLNTVLPIFLLKSVHSQTIPGRVYNSTRF